MSAYRIKPYQGTSQDRLSKLVRGAQHPVLPNSVKFAFDTPQPGTAPVAGSTVVQATASGPGRVDPPVALKYRRLEFGVLQSLPAGELVPFTNIQFPTDIHSVLPLINEALGVNLVTSEVDNTELLSIPADGITLTVNATSLAWLPGTYVFGFAPNASAPAARAESGQIPTDERGRLRLRELP